MPDIYANGVCIYAIIVHFANHPNIHSTPTDDAVTHSEISKQHAILSDIFHFYVKT